MTNFNPSRVAAGKSTGGQFAAKVNREQDIDLIEDDAPMTHKERYKDLASRCTAADLASRDAMRRNPTFETFREQFEKNKPLIIETLKYDSRTYGDGLVVPCRDFQHMIHRRMGKEHPLPKEIGGIKVNLFVNGKRRSTEVFMESPRAMRLISMNSVVSPSRELKLKDDSPVRSLIEDAHSAAQEDEAGAGCKALFSLNANKDDVSLKYAEIIYLPTRRSDFIENHGGSTPVADGWL
jgi:hypothetical protein